MNSTEAQPLASRHADRTGRSERRLPLGVGLTLGLGASLVLWTLIGAAARLVLS